MNRPPRSFGRPPIGDVGCPPGNTDPANTRFARKVENYDSQQLAAIAIGGMVLGCVIGFAIVGNPWPFF